MFVEIVFGFVVARLSFAENANFVVDPTFNMAAQSNVYVLGSPVTCELVTRCSLQCIANVNCSLFSFDENGNICQLYGGLVEPEVVGPLVTGLKFYLYAKDMRLDYIFVGASRPDFSVMEFLWEDGTVLTRDWWVGTEPNGFNECYVIIFLGGLYDIPCTYNNAFICEIPI